MDQQRVGTIHVTIEINWIPSYVPFHGEHVTHVIYTPTPIMNHDKSISLKPITPHVGIISKWTRFVWLTFVYNNRTNVMMRSWGVFSIGCVIIGVLTTNYNQLIDSICDRLLIMATGGSGGK
jgi:hypothetical protein